MPLDAPRWQARLQGMKIYANVDGLLEVGGHTVIRHWKGGRRNTLKRTRPLVGYAS